MKLISQAILFESSRYRIRKNERENAEFGYRKNERVRNMQNSDTERENDPLRKMCRSIV